MNKLHAFLYKLWYGHEFDLEMEAGVIVDVRLNSTFKNLNDAQIQKLIRNIIRENYRQLKLQKNCAHKKWNCDTQIRTIECIECGKRAWIEDYKNLYE
jgi:hypothetical protein